MCVWILQQNLLTQASGLITKTMCWHSYLNKTLLWPTNACMCAPPPNPMPHELELPLTVTAPDLEAA